MTVSPYTPVVPSTANDPLVGRVLDGRYEVLDKLAEGGMAAVHRAFDRKLGREVAVKVLRPALAHDVAFVDRFRREARAAAGLAHPHIVAVHDFGEDAGTVYLVMEYVPGVTLRDVLASEAPLTPRKATNVLAPVLDALAAAHAAGFMHRDVKPENVLIRTDGVVKVADFGLARAVGEATVTSVEGHILGTVAYLAPEQVAGRPASQRSDVYAAGLVLF